VVENRLFTGSTDGSLRIWTLKGLRSTDHTQQEDTLSVEADEVATECNAAEQ